MTAKDLKAVLAFWKATPGIGLNESDTIPALELFLKRNPGMSLVVTAGKKIAGAVLCGHDGRRGYLHHLAVAPAHRGRGLGRAMAGECLKILKIIGITRCNIFVFADNRKVRRFWEGDGWKVRGDLLVLQTETRAPQGCGGKCSGNCSSC
jgi:putative acetyltransferase